MHKLRFGVVVAALAFGLLLAVAQEGGQTAEVDAALFAQGEGLFQANCTVCHQASGQGSPPIFPALAGNESLQNTSLIVTNIHEGQGAMPSFPLFRAEEIAALATYVRNEWGNEFGGVSAEEVASQIDVAETLRSVWDGVYTPAQAERGDPVYSGACSECHGFLWVRNPAPTVEAAPSPKSEPVIIHTSYRYDKSNPPVAPSLSGRNFLERWEGQTVSSLYLFARQSMPQENPGTLSDQEYIDIIAFLFATNDIPSGDEELASDLEVLNGILIEREAVAPEPQE